jgi:hypothetical protein
VLHEVGHAIDDLYGHDGQGGLVSDGPLWGSVHQTCLPYLVQHVHRAPEGVGRRELFADAFAALTAAATVDLLDWLGGDRELVLLVQAFFVHQFKGVPWWDRS